MNFIFKLYSEKHNKISYIVKHSIKGCTGLIIFPVDQKNETVCLSRLHAFVCL